MQKHYEREVNHLNGLLFAQLDRIEHNARVVLSRPRDLDASADPFIPDRTVDQHEVVIEEECLKIIALHQPLADELRWLVTVIKANRDLERIGDLLSDIFELNMDHADLIKVLGEDGSDLLALFSLSEEAVLHACTCLRERDSSLARKTWKAKKELDDKFAALLESLKKSLTQHTATALHVDAFVVVRNLDRMASHSANVAKEVLYLVDGEIVRHRGREVLGR
jgi:phosphate transport system protein